MSLATFDKLGDGSFAGKVPPCQGVVALGDTLMECQSLLRSTLEDWLLVGLRMGHRMPVLSGLNLNGEPAAGEREGLTPRENGPASEPLDAV